MKIKNAKIESTMLGYEGHGVLSFMLWLDYGGSGQGFGGYVLDDKDPERKERLPHKACGHVISRILKTVGVEKWENLEGKHIRVKAENNKVHEIGNLLEDKWFNPGNDIKDLQI